MTKSAAIEITKLRKVFRQTSSGQPVIAIDGLNLSIAAGELVAIVGQTGCGKSTLFDILIGLERPTDGRIAIGGQAPYDDFDAFRGRIATIFQQDRLMPWRSARDNVCLPLELIGLPEDERRRRALDWLSRLGLAKFADAYPRELSGGMRQRVAIARAFALQPQILLADESFSALDEVTATELRGIFVALAREFEATAILITHQLEEAMAVGDRIVVFGRSAALLADIRMAEWPTADRPLLREAIQATLQGNASDPRLARGR